jgi:hypothetical protein
MIKNEKLPISSKDGASAVYLDAPYITQAEKNTVHWTGWWEFPNHETHEINEKHWFHVYQKMTRWVVFSAAIGVQRNNGVLLLFSSIDEGTV